MSGEAGDAAAAGAPPSVRAAKAAAAASASAAGKGPTASEKQARCVIASLVGLVAAAGLTSLVLLAFPDDPATLAPADFPTVFGPGARTPTFCLCAADAAASPHIARVFGTARAHLRASGVAAVLVDCGATLPASGRPLAERLRLSGAHPAWFLAPGSGRPVAQIGPAFSSGAALAEAVTAELARGDRVRTLANTQDLDRCVAGATAGCAFALSARPAAAVTAELAALAPVHRAMRWAVLPAAALTLHSRAGADPAAQMLLNAATRVARSAAAAAGVPRGELLAHLRRAPGAGANGALLLTVGYLAAPGAGVTALDVDALLASSRKAATVYKAASAGAADVADRLLTRDDDLLDAHSAVVQPGALFLARAKAAAAAAAAAAPAKREARRAERERSRRAADDEHGGDGASAAVDEAEEDPDAIAARAAVRAAARREAMAREAAESGFVAHLDEEGGGSNGDDNDDDDDDGGESGDGAIDLDAAADAHEEL